MVILYDRYNWPEDVFDLIFATKQQKIVAKLLVKEILDKNSEVTKREMSLFATQLHEGEYVAEIDEEPYQGKKVKLSYNKRQFYDRILTPMKGMGLIDYNLYKKTYSISENFNKDMIRAGLSWLRFIRGEKTPL